MTKKQIIIELRQEFPNTPVRQFSRIVYNKNKHLFNDWKGCYTQCLKALGKAGEKSRTNNKSAEPLNPENPYQFPKSEAVENVPIKLPLANNNILVISDIHVPYHDIQALTCAFNYGRDKKVNTIVINGDLIDFYQISRFLKDPRKKSLAYEIDVCKNFLQVLRATFPTQDIYWMLGNHDVRFNHWMMAKAPELLDIANASLESILGLNELKIRLIEDTKLVKAGKLFIHHGHLLMRGAFSPVNAARGAYVKAKQSILIGHVHKVSEHTETNLSGDITTTWSTGCLCELNPDYVPFANNYAHGFAHVIVDKEGNFKVENKRIFKGEIL
jgi:predicted phosphodiesterase